MSPRSFFEVFHPQASLACRALDAERRRRLAEKSAAKAAFWVARAREAVAHAGRART